MRYLVYLRSFLIQFLLQSSNHLFFAQKLRRIDMIAHFFEGPLLSVSQIKFLIGRSLKGQLTASSSMSEIISSDAYVDLPKNFYEIFHQRH
jgi:hypothetical protein